jgi:perosamine synthetase
VIPVHSPQIGDLEVEYVTEALRAGDVSGSGGRFIQAFEEAFAKYCGCRYGVAVSSGTTALHIASRLAGIQPGDEVVVPALTNIATANVVAQEGGVVVAVDVEPDTWNLDTTLLEAAITPRTRAIFPVHLYGHPVDMDAVMAIARRHNLFVAEDCAEAHGARSHGQQVGSFGDVGCFSFYANKVITTGEGGMLVTNRADLAERARLLRNLAFAKPRFRHEELGYNYRMTNLQAALGLAQMIRIDNIIERKRWVARRYTRRLQNVSRFELPIEREWAFNIYWMYCVVVRDGSRDALMSRLHDAGIESRTMFCPMTLQPVLHKRHAVRGSCPVSERLWAEGMYIPSGCDLTEEEIDRVCEVLTCA